MAAQIVFRFDGFGFGERATFSMSQTLGRCLSLSRIQFVQIYETRVNIRRHDDRKQSHHPADAADPVFRCRGALLWQDRERGVSAGGVADVCGRGNLRWRGRLHRAPLQPTQRVGRDSRSARRQIVAGVRRGVVEFRSRAAARADSTMAHRHDHRSRSVDFNRHGGDSDDGGQSQSATADHRENRHGAPDGVRALAIAEMGRGVGCAVVSVCGDGRGALHGLFWAALRL